MYQPIRLIPILCGILALLLAGEGKRSITNDHVLQMVKAGFEDETVLQAIEANEARFDTSPDALQALDQAGVSGRILSAMVRAARRKTTAPPLAAAQPDGLPEDDGIYAKEGTLYWELPSETVEWNGMAYVGADEDSFLTARGSTARGSHSPMQLAPPFEFLIVVPRGAAASDFGLLRAEREKSRGADRRQFKIRVVLEGPNVGWDNNPRSVVHFGLERVSPRKYRVRLPQLGTGEYAFILPGPIVEFLGKFYTFGVR